MENRSQTATRLNRGGVLKNHWKTSKRNTRSQRGQKQGNLRHH